MSWFDEIFFLDIDLRSALYWAGGYLIPKGQNESYIRPHVQPVQEDEEEDQEESE